MTRKMIYRRVLLAVLFFSVIGFFAFSYFTIRDSIPSNLKIVAGTEDELSFHVFDNAVVYEKSMPASQSGESNIPEGELHTSNPFSAEAAEAASYTINCKLFGLIDLKSIQVNVVEETYLTPSGAPVGIYMETDGILVIGTGAVTGMDGLNYEPAYNIVQSGDYILAINDIKVQNKTEMVDAINQCNNKDIVLTVRRKDEEIDIHIEPVKTGDNEYKVGIWVRDDTQGIGTMTYIDSANQFGALGHGINDVDTSTLMTLKEGKLYSAEIVSIIKGEKGSPGELSGIIYYNDESLLGEVRANTGSGIFGTLTNNEDSVKYGEAIPICLKQDIEIGPAVILSSVDGIIKEYNVEIQEINLNDSDANKGLVLRVTDEELLEKTGGIVQGMSGSPIIQNGKLVGAVTHVFIQDSTSGFGIFIENMMNQDQ